MLIVGFSHTAVNYSPTIYSGSFIYDRTGMRLATVAQDDCDGNADCSGNIRECSVFMCACGMCCFPGMSRCIAPGNVQAD